jgi:hypothetical protein
MNGLLYRSAISRRQSVGTLSLDTHCGTVDEDDEVSGGLERPTQPL